MATQPGGNVLCGAGVALDNGGVKFLLAPAFSRWPTPPAWRETPQSVCVFSRTTGTHRLTEDFRSQRSRQTNPVSQQFVRAYGRRIGRRIAAASHNGNRALLLVPHLYRAATTGSRRDLPAVHKGRRRQCPAASGAPGCTWCTGDAAIQGVARRASTPQSHHQVAGTESMSRTSSTVSVVDVTDELDVVRAPGRPPAPSCRVAPASCGRSSGQRQVHMRIAIARLHIRQWSTVTTVQCLLRRCCTNEPAAIVCPASIPESGNRLSLQLVDSACNKAAPDPVPWFTSRLSFQPA